MSGDEEINIEEHESKHFKVEVTVTNETVESNTENPEMQRRFETLGLEQIYFKTHANEQLGLDDIKKKIKDPNINVYVLLHGWTATHEIWDGVVKPNGQTNVQEILEKDPTAIIITPDGDGFGNTKFNEKALNNLEKYCGPSEYADQVQFILHDILEMTDKDKEKLYVMGHSLGGATTMLMAAKGYVKPENCVAIAPALLPILSENTNEDNFRKVRKTYGILKGVTNFGEEVAQTGMIGKAVKQSTINSIPTELIIAGLMGKNNPGSIKSKESKRTYKQLLSIHKPQIQNTRLASAVMAVLERGTDFRNLTSFGETINTNLALDRMANCDVVAAINDKLAPVLETFTSSISFVQDSYSPDQMYLGGLQIINKAGHYTPVIEVGPYSPTFLLMAKTAQSKAIQMRDEMEGIQRLSISN